MLPSVMKALVKSRPEPGLWLEEVPVPEIGINDVLIRVLRSSICGTDLHIYNWDDWARRTIPVPMVIGHEFVGRIVAVGTTTVRVLETVGLYSRHDRRRRRARSLRPLPQLSRRPASPLRAHARRRSQSARSLRRIHRFADEQRVASPRRH